MITGTVNCRREAVLRLAVLDANSNGRSSDAVVDTGFDGWISLPPTLVTALGLRWQRFGRAILADGSESLFDVYEARVLWDGQARITPVSEMDAEPLVGMSLMYGYELVLPVLDGATFTLRRISNP
jgi:clan AA aspartic protease